MWLSQKQAMYLRIPVIHNECLLCVLNCNPTMLAIHLLIMGLHVIWVLCSTLPGQSYADQSRAFATGLASGASSECCAAMP